MGHRGDFDYAAAFQMVTLSMHSIESVWCSATSHSLHVKQDCTAFLQMIMGSMHSEAFYVVLGDLFTLDQPSTMQVKECPRSMQIKADCKQTGQT